MEPLYRIARGLVRVVIRLLARVEVSGLENIPREENFILLLNHLHWVDVPLAMAVVPRQLDVFAGEKWGRRWPLNWLLSHIGHAIYVRRGEVDRKALQSALDALRRGRCLGIAPEGTRSRTGGLGKGKDGAAYLATRSGVSMVPMVAWGQERLFRSLGRGHRAVIRVVIGAPFRLPMTEARGDELDRYTEEIMRSLASMLPEEYRGAYR
jgi:1-acyl-sn-glycerol-3-phosphate acyltransferase